MPICRNVAERLAPVVLDEAREIQAAEREVFARAGVDYETREWRFQVGHGSIGERFNAELGFVPRHGVNNSFAFIARAFRPDWEVETIRGNLDTRIAKLDRGECDAIIVAAGIMAARRRLN